MKAYIAISDPEGLASSCIELQRQGYKLYTLTYVSHETLFKNEIIHEHIFDWTMDSKFVWDTSDVIIANLLVDEFESMEQKQIATLLRSAALDRRALCIYDPIHLPLLRQGVCHVEASLKFQLSKMALDYIASYDSRVFGHLESKIQFRVLVLGDCKHLSPVLASLDASKHVRQVFVSSLAGMEGEYSKVTEYKSVDNEDVMKIVQLLQELDIQYVMCGSVSVTEGMAARGATNYLCLPFLNLSESVSSLSSSFCQRKSFLNQNRILVCARETFPDMASAKSFVEMQDSNLTKYTIHSQASADCISANVIVEKCVVGKRISVTAFCDGKKALLGPGVDCVESDDENGAISRAFCVPGSAMTPELRAWVSLNVFQYILDAFVKSGSPYIGILEVELVLTSTGPVIHDIHFGAEHVSVQTSLRVLGDDMMLIAESCTKGWLSTVRGTWANGGCVAWQTNGVSGITSTAESQTSISVLSSPRCNNVDATCTNVFVMNDTSLVEAFAATRKVSEDACLSKLQNISLERPIRLGVLGSTRGTDMQFIIESIQKGWLRASIEVVVSNKKSAYILTRASQYGIPAVFQSIQGLNGRAEFDAAVTKHLQSYDVDLVLCIGYMRILSDEFVDQWENRVLNVHPSLLPEFAGGMDLNVHQEVINAGKKKTGCTVHIVTKEVDGGPIISQKPCPVYETDDADTLKDRVQALEGPAFLEAIETMRARI